MLRGPWIPDLRSLALARPGHANSRVPGECSERSCASGTRPGTQRVKREAQYSMAPPLIFDSFPRERGRARWGAASALTLLLALTGNAGAQLVDCLGGQRPTQVAELM